jgi:hypothetical protein
VAFAVLVLAGAVAVLVTRRRRSTGGDRGDGDGEAGGDAGGREAAEAW